MRGVSLYGGIELPDRPDPVNIQKLDLLQLPMIRDMVRYGFRIDPEHFRSLSSRLCARMAELRRDITSEIPATSLDRFIDLTDEDADDDPDSPPPEFKVESSKQVAELLYEVLRLDQTEKVKIKKTKSGDRLSTGKKTLEQLKRAHPIVRMILEYREASKLDGTYARTMPRHAKFHPRGPDCPLCRRRHYTDELRVHTQLMTTRAVTGRICSKSPNLANIPTRSKLGQEIRAGFVASDGHTLAQRDFAQIELRLMADASGDEVMLQVYRDDGDIHLETAMRTFNLPADKIDKLLHRAPSKNTNFAVCLAGGQKVLTQRGLVVIEKVLHNDLVWDGVEFVPHDGVIFKGYQKVINYDGITATPDHKVWTECGRVLPLAQTLAERLRLFVTAHEETPIRHTLNHVESTLGGSLPTGHGEVQCMSGRKMGDYRQSTDGKDPRLCVPPRLEISQPSVTSQIDYAALRLYQTEMFQSKKPRVGQLWRSRHSLPLHIYRRVRVLCSRTSASRDIQERRHRTYRQRWALQDWKHQARNSTSKSAQQTNHSLDRLQRPESSSNRSTRRSQTRLPRIRVDAKDNYPISISRNSLAGHSGTEGPGAIQEFYAPVYDIVNAGPRRRFTCEGKLVSNCYGITGPGLLDLMASTFSTAEQPMPDFMTEHWCDGFIQNWFGVFKGVRRHLDREEEKARRFACVWTKCGRVRRIPNVRSTHSYVQEAGVREGNNHSIQGFSADLMKLAMAELHDRLRDLSTYGIDAYPVMTIYDELIVETPEEHGETIESAMEEVMDNVLVDKSTGILQSKVPIKSDGHLMQRWIK